MQVKREAKIYQRKLPSGNTTFRVDTGRVNGKRQTKDFRHEVEALKCKAQWDAEIQRKNLGALQDLAAVNKREILLALERLAPFNASILEAVDFYIKFAMPSKGPITIEEAAKKFLEAKTRANRTLRYVKAIAANYLNPLMRAFPNRIVSEITTEEMRRFIYARKRAPKTILNYLKTLDVFFNYLVEEKHCTMNPQARIDKPTLTEGTTTPLSVKEAETLLQSAWDSDRKAECACMALVLYCGVRVEEVEKLSWADVRLNSRKVHLEGAVTKKRKRRINDISANAFEWLNLCRSEGPIAPKNYVNRMRAARKAAKVSYTQNAMRHSFASYHVALHKDAAKTAFMLGHPDANLLYNTYRDVVSEEEAVKYWDILPASVRAEADEKARIAAEEESNCGQATKDENGVWIPVINPDAVSPEFDAAAFG